MSWADKAIDDMKASYEDEIATLRIDLAAKETEALGYLRAVGTLQERIDKLEQAMERLGGMEGFSGSFYRNDNNEGRELLARTEFARAVLDQDKGGSGE